MATYNSLRTQAFRLSPDIKTLSYTWYALAFPKAWVPILQELQGIAARRRDLPNTVPTSGLNRALRALVPDLIAVNKEAGREKTADTPWIYAARPISPSALALIVKSWARATFAGAPEHDLRRVLPHLDQEQLSWEPVTVGLADYGIRPNGTADPSDAMFVFWPDWLATQLAAPDVLLNVRGHDLRFRRVSLEPGGRAAELISWPPEGLDSDDGNCFSIMIQWTVQTVPFQGWPVLHCHVGLRRWVTWPNVQWFGGNTSVYVTTRVAWLDGVDVSSAFQVGSLEFRRGSNGFEPVWADNLVAILDDLQRPAHPFIGASELLKTPLKALSTHDDTQLAIVFNSKIASGKTHPVKAGLSPSDRDAIFSAIADRIAPTVVAVDALPRVGARLRSRPVNAFGTVKDSHEAAAVQRRLAVRGLGEPSLNLEIWYQSGHIRDALTAAVCKVLGLAQPFALPHTWRTAELEVRLTAHRLGSWGAPLQDSSGYVGQNQWTASVETRANEVASQLDSVPRGVGAFVELDNNFKARAKDPKQAIRRGFALGGRLTQFITPAQEDLEHRALASVLDMLRQKGVLGHRPALPPLSLPEPLHYVGIWYVAPNTWKARQHIPQSAIILTHLCSEELAARAMILGMDNWLPLGEALLVLASGKVPNIGDPPRKALPLVRQVLEQEIRPLPNCVLFAHAQNFRRVWPWLSNKHTLVDRISFDQSVAGGMAPEEWPGLRVVRVRDDDETPQCYAQDNENIGLSKGLFTIGPRVFASTYGTPDQIQTNRRLSKFAPWLDHSEVERSPAPHKAMWNPGLVEFTVAFQQPGDDPLQLATLAHEMRSWSLQYDDATSLPLSLHLASLMREYVLSEYDKEE